MQYSIFDDTMADMNYQEIEKAAKDNSVVLFPISVIEEHGPHLPLATDTYLAYKQMIEVKKSLKEEGIKAIIAPPFYWGINFITGSFAGCFTLKKSTMVQVLVETLCCLQKWGFKKIFTCECHGDSKHNLAILEAFKIARADHGIEAYFALSENEVERFNAHEYDECLLSYKDNPTPSEPPKYMDVHAGKYETSLMLSEFPDTVNIEVAKKLKSTKITPTEFLSWRQGGESNKKTTPLGYCGDPSDINMDLNKKIFEDSCKLAAEAIYKHLKE